MFPVRSFLGGLHPLHFIGAPTVEAEVINFLKQGGI